MNDDGSLGYRSHNKINYSSQCRYDDKKFSKNMFLKSLWVSKVVDIGLLRPSTIPQVIAEVEDVGL